MATTSPACAGAAPVATDRAAATTQPNGRRRDPIPPALSAQRRCIARLCRPRRSSRRSGSAAQSHLLSNACAAPFRALPSARPPSGRSARARCGWGSARLAAVRSRHRKVHAQCSCRDPTLLFPELRLSAELGDRVVGQPALRPILSDFLYQRSVRYRVEDCVNFTLVDVTPPGETRRDKYVVGLPIVDHTGDLGNPPPCHNDVEGAGGLSLEPRRLAGSEKLRPIVEGGEDRGPGRGVDEPQADGFVGIALLLPQPGERFPDIGPAIVEERRGVAPEAAAVRYKARHEPA